MVGVNLLLLIWNFYLVGYVIVAAFIVPITMACILMVIVYFVCIRRSHVSGAPIMDPEIFHPGLPREPSSYGSFSQDFGWNQFNPIGDVPAPCPVDPVEVGRPSGLNRCCSCRQMNTFRLWRLARLVSIIPAVLLLTSFIIQVAIGFMSDALRNVALHFSLFIAIYVLLVGLMFKYKNLSFGVSVGITGLYIALTSVSLLGVKNSLLPYVLVDEFLVLAWPTERLKVYNIPVYGKNGKPI